MQWWCAAQGVAWEWTWRPYPGVWLFIVGLALVRGALARRFGSGGGPGEAGRPGRGRVWAAAAGIVLLWIALDWPVGALGAGYLASVHMVQFLLIALAAPPLLLLGVPPGAYRALGERGGRWLRVLTHPLATMGLFLAAMGWTHWPPLVDRWMATQVGSFALDMVWLGAGLLFWWPVVAPVPARPWLGHPFRMGYLIAATILNTGVFAYLTFSGLPLYAVYELAPPVSGISSRDDQRVAGLLMKMGGAVILWASITTLFVLWYLESEGGAERGRAAAAAGR